MSILVRERARLLLHATIDTPSGRRYRWAPDQDAPNIAGALTFSSTVPGGFEQASAHLARKILRDFPDLEEFSTVTIRGPGGEIAWQGRLEATPRDWSPTNQGVQPQLNGWQNHLADNNTAREIYVDRSYSNWTALSIADHLAALNASFDLDDGTSGPDWTTGEPSIVTQLTGAWSRAHAAAVLYDANGIPLSQIAVVVAAGATVGGTGWEATVGLSDTSQAVADSPALSPPFAGDWAANMFPALGAFTFAASATTRKFAYLWAEYTAAGGTDGTNYPVYWQLIQVIGRHGLTPYTGSDGAVAFLASDVCANAVSRWAPKIAIGTDTVQPSTFLIPHLAFLDPTTAADIIKQATSFELLDWMVWEGPTFWLNARGEYSRARTWRARVGEAQLQETGPQANRIYNGAVVQYTDVSGVSRSVGPPGSGCTVEDSSLYDPDPTNAATQAGLLKYAPPIQMGTGNSAAAIQVGQKYLQELKLIDTSGQATLTGHVMDDHGVLWPYWKARAGDYFIATDAADTSPRRIVRAECDDTQKTNTIQLDAPPDAMPQLLARLNVSLVGIGFGT